MLETTSIHHKNLSLSLKKISFLFIFSLLISGCTGSAQSPDFLLLNSYFPSWLVGSLASVPATVLIRYGLIKSGIDDYLPFRFFVYVGIWLVFSMGFSYFYSPR